MLFKKSTSIIITVLLYHSTIVLSNDKKSQILHGERIGKLVSNEIVNDGKYPYMVRVESSHVYKVSDTKIRTETTTCGGCIIRKDVILTAAHCLRTHKPSDVKIKAGIIGTGTKLLQRGSQVVPAQRLVLHELFDNSSQLPDHDIALIFLLRPLHLSKYVKPIELPRDSDYVQASLSITLGWGYQENGLKSKWLKKSDMILTKNSWCQLFHKSKMSNNKICLLGYNSNVCQGDSGGPLVYNNRVIGLTAGASVFNDSKNKNKKICYTELPAEFTNVHVYKSWINQHLKHNKKHF